MSRRLAAARSVEIRTLLAGHPYLRGMTDAHLELLSAHAAVRALAADQFLIRQGEAADHFYLLLSGRVAVELVARPQRVLRIETVSAGDVVGWSWLIAPYRWQFDVCAIAATRVVALEAAALRRVCATDQALAAEMQRRLLTTVSRRLAATRLQLIDVYGDYPAAPAPG